MVWRRIEFWVSMKRRKKNKKEAAEMRSIDATPLREP